MKILVTGGAGYIGSTTCSALLDSGHTPIILDSLITGRKEYIQNRIFYEGDIADCDLITKICKEHPDIECCMHFAARIIVPESVSEPLLYYNENIVKSISLLDTLQKFGIDRIIYSSSASVYKETDSFIVNEESPIAPISPYARTKYCLEMALEDFCNANICRGISFRYFNPIGADKQMRTGPSSPDPSNILGKLIKTAEGKDPFFAIMGTDWPTRDGTAIRDYIHVWDLARAHVLAAEKFDEIICTSQKYHTINLGTGKGVTVKEFVDAFIKVYGREINVKNTQRRPGDVVGACASCDKASNLLGWKADLSVEEGIADALEWQKKTFYS